MSDPRRPWPTPLRVMGILNVTPDSFWSASRFENVDHAIAAGTKMYDAGAWAVDVGGESTRPGAVPVSVDEEIARVIPVVAELAGHGVVSVDTRNHDVAEAAVGVGAQIINDVSGRLYGLAARLRVGYVSMHAHTVPVIARDPPAYVDVCGEISAFVRRRADAAASSGAQPVWIDPGIGFGKSAVDNVKLLRHLPALCEAGYPVLFGVSRKTFLGSITGRDVADRMAASLATVAPAWTAGVDVIRVHDVAETLDTIAVLEAIWA